MSAYSLASSDDSEYHINGWVGPGVMVPHLLLTIASHGDSFSIETDLIPRGPMPFGSDANYLNLFYKHEMGSTPSYRESYKPLPAKTSFYQRILQSPAYYGASDLTHAQVVDLATAHVTQWLQWVETTAPLEARYV